MALTGYDNTFYTQTSDSNDPDYLNYLSNLEMYYDSMGNPIYINPLTGAVVNAPNSAEGFESWATENNVPQQYWGDPELQRIYALGGSPGNYSLDSQQSPTPDPIDGGLTTTAIDPDLWNQTLQTQTMLAGNEYQQPRILPDTSINLDLSGGSNITQPLLDATGLDFTSSGEQTTTDLMAGGPWVTQSNSDIRSFFSGENENVDTVDDFTSTDSGNVVQDSYIPNWLHQGDYDLDQMYVDLLLGGGLNRETNEWMMGLGYGGDYNFDEPSKLDPTNMNQEGGIAEFNGTVADSLDSATDQASGALGGGMAEGDGTASDVWNFYQPYIQDYLNKAQTLSNKNEQLYPELSGDTWNYINNMRNRYQWGSPTLDSARGELEGLFGSQDPNAAFYSNVMSGQYNNDPARSFYSNFNYNNPYTNMINMPYSNPAAARYGNLSNGHIPDSTSGLYSNLYGQSNPAMGAYSGLTDRSLSDTFNSQYGALDQRVGNNPAYGLLGGMYGSTDTNTLDKLTSIEGAQDPANYSAMFGRIGNNPINNLQNLNTNNPALNQMWKTASGDYLNSNPYLDSMFNKSATMVKDQYSDAVDKINSTFSSAGRYGSQKHQDAIDKANATLGQNLNNLATDTYGQNYARERGLMENATNSFGGLYDTGLNRAMQTYSLLGDQYNQDTSTAFNTLNALSNQFNTGINRDITTAGMGNDIYNQGMSNNLNIANNLGNMYNTDTSNLYNSLGARTNLYGQDTSNLFNVAGGMGDVYNSDYANRLSALSGLGTNDARQLDAMYQGASGLSNIYNAGNDYRFNQYDALSNNYNTGLDYMFNANNNLSNIYNQDFNRMMTGAAAGSDVYNTGFNNTLSTLDPAFRFANQDYVDIGNLYNIGNIQDAWNQNRAMNDWTNLSYYGGAVNGVPILSSNPYQTQGGSAFGSAAGGAMTGYGMTGSPWGALVGGILGYGDSQGWFN